MLQFIKEPIFIPFIINSFQVSYPKYINRENSVANSQIIVTSHEFIWIRSPVV